VKEMLGLRFNTLHNLSYFARLMYQIRTAIRTGTFAEFRADFYERRNGGDGEASLSERRVNGVEAQEGVPP
jgi:queuine tRNA-ribosyltransferase